MPFPVFRAAACAAALWPLFALSAPLTLEQALDRAVQRSESTRSARSGHASAVEAARAAGQLPDPMLSVSIENLPATGPDRFSTTREGMTMKRVVLEQEWVSAEKRALRTAAARAMADREAVNVATALAETRLQTALAFVDTYYAGQVLQLALEAEAQAREAAAVGRARLATAGAAGADVLGLATAEGTSADETGEARQMLAAARVALRRWAGVAEAEVAAPALPGVLAQAAWVEAHPMVSARRRELAAARAEAAAVAANRQPNWSWEVAYGQRAGASDLVSFGVRIPLPVDPASRQDRDTAAKLAMVEKAEADLADALRAAEADHQALASDAQRLEARIRMYEASVAVPGTQRTAAARAALAGNQGSVAQVYEARRAELDVRRKLLGLQRDLMKARALLAYKPLKSEDL